MQLEAGLDTGPVYARRACADRRARRPRASCAPGWSTSVPAARRACSRRSPARDPEPQVGEPTYADKLTVDEFALDSARPADELDRIVRAGNPRPGAWMHVGGRRGEDLAGAPLDAPARRASRACLGHRRARHRPTARSSSTRCSPRASGRCRASAWRAGACRDRRAAIDAVTRAVRHRRASVALDALARGSRTARSRTSSCPRCCAVTTSNDRDRAFVTELVYGTVRHAARARLPARARSSKRPLATLDPAGARRAAPRRVPAAHRHAAARRGRARPSSVVRASARRGFVNGMLRCAGARRPAVAAARRRRASTSIGIRTSHPDWIVRALRATSSAPTTRSRRSSSTTNRRRSRCASNPLRTHGRRGRRRAARRRRRRRAAARSCPTRCSCAHTGDLGALARGARRARHAAGPGAVRRSSPCSTRSPGSACSTSPPRRAARRPPPPSACGDDGLGRRGRRPRRRACARSHARRGASALPHACSRSSPTAADSRVRDGVVRPGAARRAVHRPRACSAAGPTPAGGCSRRRRRARRRSSASCWRGAARAVRPGRPARLLRVHAHAAMETVGVDAFARVGAARLRRRSPPPGAPWRPHGAARCCVPSARGTDGMFVLVLERSR